MPARSGTDENKEFKRTATGFRIITSNPTTWVVACITGDVEVRQTFRKDRYTFRQVLAWIYDFGAILTLQVLREGEVQIGEHMQNLHNDTDTQKLCGQIALHVLRKTIALGADEIDSDAIQAAICPYITRRGIRDAMMVGVDRGVFMQTGADRWVLRDERVLTERVT